MSETRDLSDKQIDELISHWHAMRDDPYFPSELWELSLLMEIKRRRDAERKLPEES